MDSWFRYDIKDWANRVVEWNLIARNGQHDFSRGAIKLQQKLITEEENELLEAYEKKDKEAFLKELCDCLVVGVYYTFLLNPTKFYEEPLTGLTIECEEYLSIVETEELGCQYELALENLQQMIGILRQLDADTIGALNSVMDSNYSKFLRYDEWQEEWYDEMCLSIIEKGRYSGVVWDRRGDWVVIRDGNGKIMKPTTYREADIGQYVYG